MVKQILLCALFILASFSLGSSRSTRKLNANTQDLAGIYDNPMVPPEVKQFFRPIIPYIPNPPGDPMFPPTKDDPSPDSPPKSSTPTPPSNPSPNPFPSFFPPNFFPPNFFPPNFPFPFANNPSPDSPPKSSTPDPNPPPTESSTPTPPSNPSPNPFFPPNFFPPNFFPPNFFPPNFPFPFANNPNPNPPPAESTTPSPPSKPVPAPPTTPSPPSSGGNVPIVYSGSGGEGSNGHSESWWYKIDANGNVYSSPNFFSDPAVPDFQKQRARSESNYYKNGGHP